MPIQWSSDKQCALEWKIAKQNLIKFGALANNGTKIKRGTYLDKQTKKSVELTHSFMVLSGKIVVMGDVNDYIFRPSNPELARVKLAMDENQNEYALKIDYLDRGLIEMEMQVAEEVGAALGGGARMDQWRRYKGYCAYHYYGKDSLHSYLHDKKSIHPVNEDHEYDLAIQAALLIHDLHVGKASKKRQKIAHLDIKPQNIMYDNVSNIMYLIDFGFSKNLDDRTADNGGTCGYIPLPLSLYSKQEHDIFSLLRTLYLPPEFLIPKDLQFNKGEVTRRSADDAWIFSDDHVRKNDRLRQLLLSVEDKTTLSRLSALDIAREFTLMRCHLDDSFRAKLTTAKSIQQANQWYASRMDVSKDSLTVLPDVTIDRSASLMPNLCSLGLFNDKKMVQSDMPIARPFM